MATKADTVCGPTGEYYFGDPQPPQSAGYGEFVEWQESQFRRRKRPAGKKPPAKDREHAGKE